MIKEQTVYIDQCIQQKKIKCKTFLLKGCRINNKCPFWKSCFDSLGSYLKVYNIFCLNFLNGTFLFFTLSNSALFPASRFLVHVALNSKELCWPRPYLPGEQYCLL